VLGDAVYGDVSEAMIVIAAVSAPAALAYQYASAIVLAGERYEVYAGLEILHAGVLLAVGAVLVLTVGVVGAVVGLACASVCAALAGWWAIRRHREPSGHAPQSNARGVRRDAVQFGMKTWAANLLQQVNYRIDLLILGAYASTSQVGIYSVALTVTGIAWVLPQGLQMVVFPRIASLDAAAVSGTASPDGAEESAARASRHAVLLSLASAVVIGGLLAVVPLIYGPAFNDTPRLGLLMLPGVLALGVGKVLIASVTGMGYPRDPLAIGLTTVPVTLVLYFALIPGMEADGAAIASSLSYAFTALLCLVSFRRRTKVGLWATLVPRTSDLNDYLTAWRAARWSRS
jgi:O-antigen/teichoic acid export membrane protein